MGGGGGIQVSVKSRIFEMRKPLKKDMNQGESDEDELKHPEVYISFSVSCDIQLEDLLNSIVF